MLFCPKHDLLLNIMFTRLRDNGCNVYVDVKFPVQPIIRKGITAGPGGVLIPTAQTQTHGRIDLVAICDGNVFGYEIKSDFNSVMNAITQHQLSLYTSSGFFDRVYLVVPDEYCGELVCERVKQSYGSILRQKGIGLICVNSATGVPTVIIASVNHRKSGMNIQRYLRINHEYFKQEVIAYYRSLGYDVYPEAFIPKPPSYCGISRARSNPTKWLNRIDLVIDGCKDGVCGYLCSKKNCYEGDCEIIGVEVKYGPSVSSLHIKKLQEYLDSQVLTRVQVALGGVSTAFINRAIRRLNGIADLLVKGQSGFSLNRIGARRSPSICAFVFQEPSWAKLTIYSFVNMCCQKFQLDLTSPKGSKYYHILYQSASDQMQTIREILLNEVGITGCTRKCGIIFVRRRTRTSGHVCYIDIPKQV